jgi:hypothetical protein
MGPFKIEQRLEFIAVDQPLTFTVVILEAGSEKVLLNKSTALWV